MSVHKAAGWRSGPARTSRGARWAKNGYRILYLDRSNRKRKNRGWWVRNHIPQSARLLQAKAREAERQLDIGTFEPAPSQDPHELVRRGYKISPGFMIEQDKKDRLVVHQKKLNGECVKKSMKYETLKAVRYLARPGYHFQSRDIVDGYGHFMINVDDRRDMAIDLGLIPGWKGPRFVLSAGMCFGHVNACWGFSKLVKPVVTECRRRGCLILAYLDDFLVAGKTKKACDRNARILDETLEKYGFESHKVKGQHESLQTILHLGLGIDSARNLFLVPPVKVAKIKKMAKQLLGAIAHNERRVSARWLASFAGLCISVSLAVPFAQFYTRGIFDCLSAQGVYKNRWGWSQKVRASKAVVGNLRWWLELGGEHNGRTVWRPPTDKTCATDASLRQWGGVLHSGCPSKPEKQPYNFWDRVPVEDTVPAWGFWSPKERKRHITFLELRAFRRSIEAFGPRVARSVLLAWNDNKGVVGIMNKMCSRSPEMMAELRLVIALLARLDVDVRMRWVPSAFNPSDFYTRFASKAEWRLNPRVAHSVMHQWGGCTVDRFATAETALLPRFDSPMKSLGCEAVDTMTAVWAGERSWLNPPLNRMAQVLAKLRDEPTAEAVVLAPKWYGAPWWPLLAALSDEAVDIDLHAAGVVQPGVHCRGKPEPLRNAGWRFAVFHVPPRG